MFTAAQELGNTDLAWDIPLFFNFAVMSFCCLSVSINPPPSPLHYHHHHPHSIYFFHFFLFLQLLEAQADYHRKSLTVLENVLPTIQAQQGKKKPKQQHMKSGCTHTHTVALLKKSWRTRKTLCGLMIWELFTCFLENAHVPFFPLFFPPERRPLFFSCVVWCPC